MLIMSIMNGKRMYKEINNLLLSENREDNMLGVILMSKVCPHNLKNKFYKEWLKPANTIPIYIMDVLGANKKRTVGNYIKYLEIMKEYESEFEEFNTLGE